jgi:hypothetical protein
MSHADQNLAACPHHRGRTLQLNWGRALWSPTPAILRVAREQDHPFEVQFVGSRWKPGNLADDRAQFAFDADPFAGMKQPSQRAARRFRSVSRRRLWERYRRDADRRPPPQMRPNPVRAPTYPRSVARDALPPGLRSGVQPGLHDYATVDRPRRRAVVPPPQPRSRH